jgi:thiol-disulfide isomerase/thioredoxin
MRKLVVHEAPRAAGGDFGDLDGAGFALSDFAGEIVVLNFWATWCAPCRKEMPSLDALQAALGDRGLEVVAVATGRNAPDAIRRFFDETGVTHLHPYNDPRMDLARGMAVLGLPVTVILDREGREIARLTGEADWNGPAARAVLEGLLADT